VFQRIAAQSAEEVAARLEACTELPLLNDDPAAPSVLLHAGVMEAAPRHTAFVNFANANYGYGRFIPSCTQEEILQVCCPEVNVGMLVIGKMGAGEVVNVLGCRRFSTYSGYLHTFACEGPLFDGPVLDVLTLDACTRRHFDEREQLRDLAKAAASFAALSAAHTAPSPPRPVVSTGRWGCGVFGGLPAHKFLQQLVAARLAGVDLEFSTYGTPDGCDVLLDALRAHPISVARAWDLLKQHTARATFQADVIRALSTAHESGTLPAAASVPGARAVAVAAGLSATAAVVAVAARSLYDVV